MYTYLYARYWNWIFREAFFHKYMPFWVPNFVVKSEEILLHAKNYTILYLLMRNYAKAGIMMLKCKNGISIEWEF